MNTGKVKYIEFGFWLPIFAIIAVMFFCYEAGAQAERLESFEKGYKKGIELGQAMKEADVRRQCNSPLPLLLDIEWYYCAPKKDQPNLKFRGKIK